MAVDPVTASLMALGPSIIGSKQLGQAAPAFQPGNSQGVAGLLNMAQGQNNFGNPFQPLSELTAAPTTQGPPVDTTADEVGPPAANPLVGPPTAENDPLAKPSGFGGLLSGAFDNLDQNLQSPSKVLGLGLLSQIDPRLAQGGLLAGALFGKNKLF